MSFVNIPCREIDVYVTESWEEKKFFDSEHIIGEIEILLKSDYEIGIDVPSEILSPENIKILNEVSIKISEYIHNESQ